MKELIVVQAKEISVALPGGPAGELPAEIQWMPPGEHRIRASKAGKKIELTVRVNAAGARRVAASLQELRAKALAGDGDEPYLDFNHDDEKASAYVTEVYWGGEDPKTGGIRAKVEWTGSGERALKGRDFRRFSPEFFANAEGEVIGAPLNMGGLVNRAAFRTITPIVAGEPGETEETDMSDKALETTVSEQKTKIAELERQLAAANSDQAVKAKDAEIAQKDARIRALETAAEEDKKIRAKEVVAAAVTAGKIPAKDKETIEQFEALYLANPVLAKGTLEKLPVNAALATIVPTPGAGGERRDPPGGGSGEHEFVVKAREHADAAKISFTEATVAIAAKEPALYEGYMESLTAKS